MEKDSLGRPLMEQLKPKDVEEDMFAVASLHSAVTQLASNSKNRERALSIFQTTVHVLDLNSRVRAPDVQVQNPQRHLLTWHDNHWRLNVCCGLVGFKRSFARTPPLEDDVLHV